MRTKFTLVFILSVLTVGPVFSQEFQGTLRGEVRDELGGKVAGAAVTLVNDETGETRTQESSDAGRFNFPKLLISNYTLAVESQGFNTYVREGIVVRTNQVSEVKVTLEVGAVTVTVFVKAGIDLVQTLDAQIVGGTFGSREIMDLPLADPAKQWGDPTGLAIYLPGTTTQSGGVMGQGGAIGGNRPRMNSFTIDGVDNNNPTESGGLTPVIQEAVQEFTLLTNQFSAEYGHSTAGQFITTTRSGTNDFRGRAWWFNQNRHTNALDTLTRAVTPKGDPKPRHDWNRLGAQLGGPILEDKWFFFGSYEYRNFTLDGTSSGQILVPTAAGLSTLQNLAADPTTGVSPNTVGLLTDHVPPASSATTTSPVFNEATSLSVPIELGPFSATTPQFDRAHLFMISSDYQTGQHRISGRYHYSRNRQVAAGALPVEEFNIDVFKDTHRITLSDVFTVNPNVINEFRAGYTRNANGFPVDPVSSPGSTDVFGNYNITDINLFIGPPNFAPQLDHNNIYQASDTLLFSAGAHTLKAGVEVRNIISSFNFLPRERGAFDYGSLDEFARDRFPSLSAARGVGNGTFAQNRAAFYTFIQDNWQIHPRVTLDLGLRYEYTQVARDSALQELNAISNIDSIRDELDSSGAKIFDSLPQRHQDALISHIGESVIFRKPTADTNNWAPRIGLAWDIFGDGKTSLRAGFGVAHDVIIGNFQLIQSPPQKQGVNQTTNACGLSPAPQWCTQVGPGETPLTADIRHSTVGFIAGEGLLPSIPTDTATNRDSARFVTAAYMVDDIAPETYTWSLALQREVSDDLVVEARYVGTHAIHLPVQRFLSAGVPNPFKLPTFINESDALGQDFTGAPSNLDFLLTQNILLVPYGFDGFLFEFTPDGQSWYHGASFMVQKRFSGGFSFDANYTWSKTIDLAENELFSSLMNPRRPFDHLDIFASKGRSGLDHSHKFALSWLWELPIYTAGSSFLNQLLSGWQFNGTYLAETGQPVSILSQRDLNADFDPAGDPVLENPAGIPDTGTDVNFVCWDGSSASIGASIGDCGGRSSVVGYVAQDPTARYIRGQAGTDPNLGRNTFTSPGINVWNLSFFKNTALPWGEGTTLQFRVEMWNAFNHANPTVGNGSAFNTLFTGNNATSLPGYITPGSSQFLDETIFSGGLGNAPFQRVIQWGLRLLF